MHCGGLPSTPLKATENRADRWKAAMGWEQTEIDALATLRPEVLERIARAALDPFFDRTLEDRADEALDDYCDTQTARLHEHLGADRIAAIRDEMEAKIDEVREQLDALREQLAVPADDLGLDPYEPPQPILGGLPSDYPEPLLDPADDWVSQTDQLRARKHY